MCLLSLHHKRQLFTAGQNLSSGCQTVNFGQSKAGVCCLHLPEWPPQRPTAAHLCWGNLAPSPRAPLSPLDASCSPWMKGSGGMQRPRGPPRVLGLVTVKPHRSLSLVTTSLSEQCLSSPKGRRVGLQSFSRLEFLASVSLPIPFCSTSTPGELSPERMDGI